MQAASFARRAARLVRYAWAAPASLVGLLAATAALATGATVRRVDGILEVAGGAVPSLVAHLPRALRFDAITLGHVVLGVDPEALDACRDHERVHVAQYERWGLAFFPLYLASSAIACVAGRDPYRHNHFERQAFARVPIAPRRSPPPA